MVAKVTQLPRSGRHSSSQGEAGARGESGRSRLYARILLIIAAGASLIWIGICYFYVKKMLGRDLAKRLITAEVGALVAGGATPAAGAGRGSWGGRREQLGGGRGGAG